MGLRFPHADLKAPEIDLAHGALADDAVVVIAVKLLVVRGIVLDGGPPPGMGLDAPGDGRGEGAAQERILREVFKVPAAADAPVDVQRGREPEIHIHPLHLVPDDVSALPRKVRVPALGQRGSDGDRRGVLVADLGPGIRLLSAQPGEQPLCGLRHEVLHGFQRGLPHGHGALFPHDIVAAQAQAGRAVRHHQRFQTEVLCQAAGLAGRAGHGEARAADDGGKAVFRIMGPEGHLDELLRAHAADRLVDLKAAGVLHRLRRDRAGIHREDRNLRGEHVDALQLRLPVGKVRNAADVLCLSGDDLFLQPQADNRSGILGTCPEAQEVIPLLQHPAGPGAVVGREVRHAKRHGDGVRLLRPEEPGLSEGREALEGLVELTLRLRYIDLKRLLPGEGAGVFHRSGDRDGLAVQLRLLFTDFKCRIRQAEAEGEHRSHSGRVKVPVADVDALPVARLVHVAEVPDGGIVVKGGPGGRELSGGIGLSQQEIGQHAARLHTELGEEQDVPDLAEHRGKIHRSAHVQHQEELFILLLQKEDVTDFRFREGDVSRDVFPIVSFPGGPREHVDRGLSAAFQRQVVFRFRHDGAHSLDDGVGVVPSRAGFDLADEVFLRLFAYRVVGIPPVFGGQAEARGLQALFHGDKITGVYLPGARTALYRLSGTAAKEGEFPCLGERETSVRLQQDRALREGSPEGLDMFPFVILQLTAESIEIRRLFHVCLPCRQRYFSSIGVCSPSWWALVCTSMYWAFSLSYRIRWLEYSPS